MKKKKKDDPNNKERCGNDTVGKSRIKHSKGNVRHAVFLLLSVPLIISAGEPDIVGPAIPLQVCPGAM